MATIGLAFFMEGFGDLMWTSQIKTLDLGIQQGIVGWLDEWTFNTFGYGMYIDRLDVTATVVAALLVVGLTIFSQYTRTGRALRAVADDHQAALSVGISLRAIWVIVWAIAGFVALVAGVMWGAKSGVQFSLSLIALKALPVLMLGGFTSIPGAIVGGLIIGVGEKLFEYLIGPMIGGATENWFAYHAGAAVPVLPAAGAVRREDHREGLMLYREAGDFKTSYRADSATFPIAFDRWRYWAVLAVAFLVVPFFMTDYLAKSMLLPFLVWSIAAHRAEHPDWLYRPRLARHRRVHGGRRLCLLQADDGLRLARHLALHPPQRASSRPASACSSACRRSGSRASTSPSPRWRRSSSWSGCSTRCRGSTTIRRPARSRRRRATVLGLVQVTGPRSTPEAQYLFCLGFAVVLAWLARNLTRGRVGREWMAIRDMDIAAEIIGVNPLKAKLTAFAVSSFFVGIAGALYFSVWFGAVEVTEAFGIIQSFRVLFMIIIGGLGSIFGSFVGAAFIVAAAGRAKVLMVDNLAGRPISRRISSS